MVLLDLVNAFERVPHRRLVHVAEALGYPLWLIRLSLAAYRLPRTVRIAEVYSKPIVATRGIVAGSGFATTEMRIIMIRRVDRACTVSPQTIPILVLDDLAAEHTAPVSHVVEGHGNFVCEVASGINATQMELSSTKCICTASTDALGKRLGARLRPLQVGYQRRAKSLGVGPGGGWRRNAQILNDRLKQFRSRAGRFRLLRRSGVDTARLVRTGSNASMMYGVGITGVPVPRYGGKGVPLHSRLHQPVAPVGKTWT